MVALDGLRAVAIMLVILCHTPGKLVWPAGEVAQTVSGVLRSGWIGVDIFFVLSGFLITGILVGAREGGGTRQYYGAFYARRALRIVPAYYVFLAFVFLVWRQPSPYGTWWYWTYFTNLLVLHAPDYAVAQAHLWSLAVEEQFYLVWPAVVALAPTRWLRSVCWVIVILATCCRLFVTARFGWHVAYVLTICRIDELAAGGLLALHYRQDPRRRPNGLVLQLGALLVAGWLMLRAIEDKIAVPYTPLRFETACVMATALSIICIAAVAPPNQNSGLARILRASPLVSIGRYSYMIYIVHLEVGTRLDVALSSISIEYPWQAIGIHIVGTLAISWAIAWMSWRLIEQPALSLKHYFPMPGPGRPLAESPGDVLPIG